MPKFKIASLFSGMGVPEMAIKEIFDLMQEQYKLIDEKLEIEHVFYCDWEPMASKAYATMHDVSEELNLWDILKITDEQIAQYQDLDYLHASPPCTSFSRAGKREGADKGSDTESAAFWKVLDFIRIIKPKFITMENVSDWEKDKKFNHTFYEMLSILKQYGYKVGFRHYNSKDFGVAQNRERVFIVAIRNDINVLPKLVESNTKMTEPRFTTYAKPSLNLLLSEANDRSPLITTSEVPKEFWDQEIIFIQNNMKQYNFNSIDKKGNPINYLIGVEPKVLFNQEIGKINKVAKIYYIMKKEEIESATHTWILEKHVQQGAKHFLVMKKSTKKEQELSTNENWVNFSENLLGKPIFVKKINYQSNQSFLGVGGIAGTLRAGDADFQNKVMYVTEIKFKQDTMFLGTNGIVGALAANSPDFKNKIMFSDNLKLNYRKLTGLECFRIMSIPDEYYEKGIANNLSESSLIKRAGNSIVFEVMLYILWQLLEVVLKEEFESLKALEGGEV